jgi:DNA modification methylase
LKVNFGDVVRIGNHWLLCGDSTEAPMVKAFLSEEPRLMVSDPPYGVNYQVRDRKHASGRSISADLEDIKIRNDHRTNWSKAFYLSRAQVAYIWHSSTAIDVAIAAVRDGDYQPRQSIIWLKNKHTLSRSAYHWRHESVSQQQIRSRQ